MVDAGLIKAGLALAVGIHTRLLIVTIYHGSADVIQVNTAWRTLEVQLLIQATISGFTPQSLPGCHMPCESEFIFAELNAGLI